MDVEVVVLGSVLSVIFHSAGASIGHDIARRSVRHDYQAAQPQRFEMVHDYPEEERIEGYDVRYVYNGRGFVRRMDHPPDRKVRVRVRVTPEA